MLSIRYRQALAFAGIVGGIAIAANASRLGHPGVSTKAATGAQTQWNLISDPVDVTVGSDTTLYTNNASISEVDPVFPYQIKSVIVELSPQSDPTSGLTYLNYAPGRDGIVHINPTTFNGLTETGRVQVSWAIKPGVILPTATDDNTDILRFNQAPGTFNPYATFTDTMVDYGTGKGVPPADFYSGFNPQPFTYSSDPQSPFFTTFDTETITLFRGTTHGTTQPPEEGGVKLKSALTSVPEPSSIALAGILSAIGLLRRRRN